MAVAAGTPRVIARSKSFSYRTQILSDAQTWNGYNMYSPRSPHIIPNYTLTSFIAKTIDVSSGFGYTLEYTRAYIIGIDVSAEGANVSGPWPSTSISNAWRTGTGLTQMGISATTPNVSGLTNTSSSTPTAASLSRWTAAWSDDSTTIASLQITTSTYEAYLSLSVGSTSLIVRQALGIYMDTRGAYESQDYWYWTIGYAGFPKIFTKSSTDVWIIFVDYSVSSGGSSRPLRLAVHNGTSITYNQPIGSLSVYDFEAVRRNGYIYLFVRPFTSISTVQVYAINESTKAVTLLRTENHSTLYGRAAINRTAERMTVCDVFPHKGWNYILTTWQGWVLIHKFQDSAPTTMLLHAHAIGPYNGNVDEYDTTSPYFFPIEGHGRSCGIEYDPESDTALVVFVDPRPYPTGSGKRDMCIWVHTQDLLATSFVWKFRACAEPSDFVVNDNSSVSAIEPVGLVPNRQGMLGQSLFMVNNTFTGNDYSNGPCLVIHRLLLWSVPKVVDLFMDAISVPVQVSASVVLDKEFSAVNTLGYTVASPSLSRPRSASWATEWGATADTSVFLETTIAPPLGFTVTLSAAGTFDLDVPIRIAPNVEVTLDADRVALFDVHYMSVGSTFVEEFHQIVNEERANLFGLPPLTIAGHTPITLDTLTSSDIAQIHSDHMEATGIAEHDADEYPVGWRYLEERLLYVIGQAGIGGENVQYRVGNYTSTTLLPTPASVFAAWKESPGHYANLMRDWHAEAGADLRDHVFAFIGIAYGPERYEDGTETGSGASAFYFTHIFATIKEGKVETNVTYSWQTENLEAAELSHSWQTSALRNVTGHNTIVYAPTVQGYHHTEYANRVTAHHDSSNTHGVRLGFEINFTNSKNAHMQSHTTGYELSPWRASAQHVAPWGNNIARGHTTEYEDAPRAAAQHIAPYDQPPQVAKSHTLVYGQPVPLAAAHAMAYGGRFDVTAEHTAPLTYVNPVQGHADVLYALLPTNPVGREHQSLYGLSEARGAVFHEPYTRVMINGRVLEVDDGVLSAGIESAGFTFECAVNDLSFLRDASLLDAAQVDVNGTVYEMFLSAINSDSAERSAAPTKTIRCASPIFLLDAPYAENITYAPDTPKMFSAIVEEALGVPVDFGAHIDWMIPFGRAQASGVTPLAAAMAFLGAVGSFIQSNPDGSVYVAMRYPYGLDSLPVGTPDHTISADGDAFTHRADHEYARGYNRFRVRDAEASYGDLIEYDQDSSTASVWVSPYRSNWSLGCTTDALGAGLLLEPLGEEVIEHEEILDFKAGATDATYPILEFVSIDWVSKALGGIAFEPYSSKVACPLGVNFGYGLAKVVYRTKVSKFRLTTSTPIEATQLIVVEH